MIIYLLLSINKIKYEEKESILKTLNLLSIRQCGRWLNTILDEDDLCCILKDERGSYKRDNFYDLYPELEKEARIFALEQASLKKSSFCVYDLALFITEKFKELYDHNVDLFPNKFIRSISSFRVDLMTWGFKYDNNKNRPYFEGHEREDVIIKRKEFCNYFTENKHLYYYTKRDSKNYPYFVINFFNLLFYDLFFIKLIL
jgi:hypothetical protein